MNKIERLEALFERWEKAHAEESDKSFAKTSNGSNIKKHFFERDGIIDEEAFSREKVKVLFISAEANVNEYAEKKSVEKTNYRQHYLDYAKTGHDDWGGKMRERLSGMYRYISKQHDKELKEMATKFAVMDINKRGGCSTIDKGAHLKEYAKIYKNYINEEIQIIDPDVVVLLGVNLCRLKIVQSLGCESESDRNYFVINGKKVPILLSFQTANVEFQKKKFPPLEDCGNTAIGILCNKLKQEMEKYGLV